MKKFLILGIFLICVSGMWLHPILAKNTLPLVGKIIIIDPGHGKLDPGTVYGDIYEKDINLQISLILKEKLESYGAVVLMTREGDYDLASPNAIYRKKSDFDNRIKFINGSKGDLYLSIHQNYLSDSKYSGSQVFYTADNKLLAQSIQQVLNKELKNDRESKMIPNTKYMYSKLYIKGVLVECGFLSNKEEREKLITTKYQQEFAEALAKAIIVYYA